MKIELVNTEWFDRLSDTDKTKVQVMDAFLKNSFTTLEEGEAERTGPVGQQLMTSEEICDKLFPAIAMTNEFVATVMRLMGFEMTYDRQRETVVWVLWVAVW